MGSAAVFIIAHGDMASSLKSTVEQIMGNQENIFTYTNKTDSLPVLFKKINDHIESLNAEDTYLFVDLVGGSCWNLASMLKKENPKLTVVGGVNLPMIISFLVNYQNLPQMALVEKIVEDSKKGIHIL